jgi:ATP-binding cassette subfamily C (CFTR/MRP) protein 1
MTDQVIQETINRDFANTTLICIAHRLRTIIGWDRIAVMDAGRIAEIAPPLELFDSTDGIFRSLCDKSSITRAEIERAQVQTKEQRQAKDVSVGLN